MKFSEWINIQNKFTEHLSKSENWSPLLKHVARTYLVVGGVLGFIMGISLGLLISML